MLYLAHINGREEQKKEIVRREILPANLIGVTLFIKRALKIGRGRYHSRLSSGWDAIVQILLRESIKLHVVCPNLGWQWNVVSTDFCIKAIIQQNVLNLQIVAKYARSNSCV